MFHAFKGLGLPNYVASLSKVFIIILIIIIIQLLYFSPIKIFHILSCFQSLCLTKIVMKTVSMHF